MTHSIVSLVDNPCNPDSRVMRMAETLVSAGHSVTIVCKYVDPLPRDEAVNGVRYLRVPMRARPLRPRSGLFKFGAFSSFVETAVLALAPTAIHANDLISLPAATRIADRTGAAVVYDVHDLYLFDHKDRSRLALWHGERTERRNIRRADAVITVSDSMADHLQRYYGIARPTVVMNAPDIRVWDEAESGRRSLRDEIGVDPETPLGVFTGQRHLSRGVESLARALDHVPGLHLALVGFGNADGDAQLAGIAEDGRFAERLHILPPVPHDMVTAYIASADFAIIPQYDPCLNIQYSMPHKLFEAVFAGLPVAVADMPEMRGFVENTRTGLIMDTGSVDDIARVMGRMAKERHGLRLGDDRVEALKEQYGWPAQAKKLVDLYGRLGARGEAASSAIAAA